MASQVSPPGIVALPGTAAPQGIAAVPGIAAVSEVCPGLGPILAQELPVLSQEWLLSAGQCVSWLPGLAVMLVYTVQNTQTGICVCGATAYY